MAVKIWLFFFGKVEFEFRVKFENLAWFGQVLVIFSVENW